MQIIVYCLIPIVAFIISKIINMPFFNEFMFRLGIHRNNFNNVLEDLIDYKHGTFIRVYLSDENIVYQGAIIKFHYNGSYDQAFIVLCNYIVQKYGETKIDDNYMNYFIEPRSRELAYLKLSKISRIEALYNESSKKLIKESKKKTKFKDKIRNIYSDFCKEYKFISNDESLRNSMKMWSILWIYMLYIVLIKLFF